MIFYDQFRIIKLQEIVINTCNNIIFQTFKLMLRINKHFEVRKRVLEKKNYNFQSKEYEVTIVIFLGPSF